MKTLLLGMAFTLSAVGGCTAWQLACALNQDAPTIEVRQNAAFADDDARAIPVDVECEQW